MLLGPKFLFKAEERGNDCLLIYTITTTTTLICVWTAFVHVTCVWFYAFNKKSFKNESMFLLNDGV